MNSKPLVFTTVAAALMAIPYTAKAECEDHFHGAEAGHSAHLILASNDGNQSKHNNQGKKDKDHANDGRAWYKPWSWDDNGQKHDDDDDGNHNNQNSNRQSDPDSTRGQARAEERRGDKDKESTNNDRPWYNPLGWFD